MMIWITWLASLPLPLLLAMFINTCVLAILPQCSKQAWFKRYAQIVLLSILFWIFHTFLLQYPSTNQWTIS